MLVIKVNDNLADVSVWRLSDFDELFSSSFHFFSVSLIQHEIQYAEFVINIDPTLTCTWPSCSSFVFMDFLSFFFWSSTMLNSKYLQDLSSLVLKTSDFILHFSLHHHFPVSFLTYYDAVICGYQGHIHGSDRVLSTPVIGGSRLPFYHLDKSHVLFIRSFIFLLFTNDVYHFNFHTFSFFLNVNRHSNFQKLMLFPFVDIFFFQIIWIYLSKLETMRWIIHESRDIFLIVFWYLRF